jgi:hypothetical protein
MLLEGELRGVGAEEALGAFAVADAEYAGGDAQRGRGISGVAVRPVEAPAGGEEALEVGETSAGSAWGSLGSQGWISVS